MKNKIFKILLLLILILCFVLIFDINGVYLFHKSAEDSKDHDAFVHSFKIKGSKTFIIEKDTFEIEEFWVSHMTYSTNFRFKTKVKRDSYILNLRISKSSLFEQNYRKSTFNDKGDYTFYLCIRNIDNKISFNETRGTNELIIQLRILDKNSFQNLLAEENKYIYLYKDSLPIKKFNLVN